MIWYRILAGAKKSLVRPCPGVKPSNFLATSPIRLSIHFQWIYIYQAIYTFQYISRGYRSCSYQCDNWYVSNWRLALKPEIYRISLDRFHSFACSVVVPWVSFTWNCLIQLFTSCVEPRSGSDDWDGHLWSENICTKKNCCLADLGWLMLAFPPIEPLSDLGMRYPVEILAAYWIYSWRWWRWA